MKSIRAFLAVLVLLVPLSGIAQAVIQATPDPLPFTTLCRSGAVDFTATVTDDGRRNARYFVRLYYRSTEGGDIVAQEVGTYTGTITTRTAGVFTATNKIRVQFTMPASLYGLSGCSVKVFSMDNGQLASSAVASTTFAIRPIATLLISGTPTITTGTPAPINFTFSGTPPFTVDYNDYSNEYANAGYLRTQTFNSTTATVTPRLNVFSPQVTYDNGFVRNLRDNSGCSGPNQIQGAATVKSTPLGLIAYPERAVVCAGSSMGVRYGPSDNSVQLKGDFIPLVQLSDSQGSFANPVTIGTGTVGNTTATVIIPDNTAPGTYRIQVTSPRADYSALINPLYASITVSKADKPTVTNPASPCQGENGVTLQAAGNGTINWYDASGNRLAGAPTQQTGNAGTFGYRVSQTVGGCESERVDVSVTIRSRSSAPSTNQSITYCRNQAAEALSANGPGLIWYDKDRTSIGTDSPRPNTSSAGQQTFFVSRDDNGCRSELTPITVTVNDIPSAPSVTVPNAVCQFKDVPALSATGQNLRWYRQETGGNAESQLKPTSDQGGTTAFWVSQVVANCEGPRAKIEQKIDAASPDPGTATLLLCRDQAAPALSATGQNLRWYDGNGTFLSTDAPRPPTDQVRDLTYRVSQNSTGCESRLVNLLVQVRATPSAPGVMPVSLCQNQTAQPLTATGAGLTWYEQATGGTSSSAVTPQTTVAGDRTYWVSQRFGTCESPRAALLVSVYTAPPAPTAADRTYCINDIPTALTAVGQNLRWYDGSGSPKTSLTPSTSQSQSLTFAVTQTQNGCESAAKQLTVRILPKATVRLTGDSVSVLYDSTAIRLQFSGEAPWRVRLWDGQTITTSSNPLVRWVKPTQTGTSTFMVQALDNDCGAGQILNTFRLTVLAPLAIEPDPALHVTLSPNPARHEVHVRWVRSALNQPPALWLTNALGQQVVLPRLLRWAGDGYEDRLPVQQLPPGLYYLTLEADQHRYTRKLIIL